MILKKDWPILLLILFMAFFLRVWQLDKVPIELFGDEIDVGIQAYSILKTGKDYSGNNFPAMFESFKEYRLPLFIYSAVPFISVFGLNEWGLRLTGVFWGMMGILGIFLLTKEIFNKKVATTAALLLAITPWHLHYSRQAGIEAIMLLTVVTFGIWSFFRGLNSFKWLVFSIVILLLSIYVYPVSLIFIASFWLVIMFLYWKKFIRYGYKKITFLIMVSFLMLLPYFNLYLQGKAGERFAVVSLFTNSDIVAEIGKWRNQESKPGSEIFHNKPLSYLQSISNNYFKAFSVEFLFIYGDPNLRQSVYGVGELYLFEFICLILGLYLIIKKDGFSPKGNNLKLIFIWLCLAPISASLTGDGGSHASRLILMLAPLTIISAVGLFFIFSQLRNFKGKIIFTLLIFLGIMNISIYLHKYYTEWPIDSWVFWQYGYKEAMSFAAENESKYERIFFNNTYEPALPRFLFWAKFDPEKFQELYKGNQNIKDIVPGFNGFKLGDKYYFGIVSKLIKDEGIKDVLGENDLYMVSARDEVGTDNWVSSPPPHLNVLKTIYNPYNQPIFYIVTKKS